MGDAPPSDRIETERLVLRWFRPDDLEDLVPFLADPQVMRFSLKGPLSREETQQFLDRCLAGYTERGMGLFAIVPKTQARAIGYCGFLLQNVEGRQEIEIGYRLHPDFWNCGLATEAATAVRDHGFRDKGYDRLISIIEAENTASVRVAEKNGMTYERDSVMKGIPVRIYAIERAR